MAELLAATDGALDFDFLVGDWIIDNRRLTLPFSGSNEWETFQARQTNQRLPGGIGNYDDFVSDTWRPGFVGMSLRIFNPVTRLWSIYWLNNKNGGIDSHSGALTPPVVGQFRDGTGVFEGQDDFNGQPILVRYTWSHITPVSARWQQAFSQDGGKNWETNWVMEMTRFNPGP